ncbi:dihydrofolate reductase family protein [Actinomadura sp. DC4]|uniref:dihydrofolate reductase family protein n=1 Tax=Actinomadura sp. DC4 TaxID=3055069 RepID=UPI0025B1F45C|nr:dihydrofolate reductase family protein [Actinomadura sp. DC4]MDN3354098.1 dihydrofolate reductase family protein [Actinomadura sp. DC4]
MRKIVFFMSVSLDGFIEGPDGDLDWHMVDDEVHTHFNEELAAMGAFVNGRITYDLMLESWPTADTDPWSTEPMREFARIWRDTPKIVYSRSRDYTDWNPTVIREVVPAQVAELKEKAGGDLALVGADIAASFRRHDLIDEYRLFVHPVVIGEGKRLFRTREPKFDLRLAETRAFGNGVVGLRYTR